MPQTYHRGSSDGSPTERKRFEEGRVMWKVVMGVNIVTTNEGIRVYLDDKVSQV